MVAEARHHRGVEPPESLGGMLLAQRPHAAVNDVAANEYDVGVLLVYEVYPSVQLPLSVEVARVQVRSHQYLQRLLQRFLRVQRQRAALLVHIVDVAASEHKQHHARHHQRALQAMEHERVGHEVHGAPQVQQPIQHHEVQHHEDTGVANLVDRRSQRHRHLVQGTAEVAENH